MSRTTRTYRCNLSCSASKAWDFHMRPGAFERLTPPWERVKIAERTGSLSQIGTRVVLKSRHGPIPFTWVAEITDFQEGSSFTDIMVKGPFREWRHTHRVIPEGESSCIWEDEVEYTPPWGVSDSYAKKKLDRLFSYRHTTLQNDIIVLQRYPLAPKRILVSGTSGFIGRAIVPFLRAAGHDVVRLVRRPTTESDALFWDPESGKGDAADFEGFDGVIHLAGKNITKGRWTPSYKEEMFQSRCRDSWLLAKTLSRTKTPPQVVISASAIGFYGHRPGEILTEESRVGEGFLPHLCECWEGSFESVAEKGARTVQTRFGLVLSSRGGMLERVLPIFRMGLGAIVGRGEMPMSWIGLDDLMYAIYHCLAKEDVMGPVNFVSPKRTTSQSFSDTLAKHLHRPRVLRIPEKALRLLLGELADEMLLAETSVDPNRLEASGYTFSFPTLDEVLSYTLE